MAGERPFVPVVLVPCLRGLVRVTARLSLVLLAFHVPAWLGLAFLWQVDGRDWGVLSLPVLSVMMMAAVVCVPPLVAVLAYWGVRGLKWRIDGREVIVLGSGGQERRMHIAAYQVNALGATVYDRAGVSQHITALCRRDWRLLRAYLRRLEEQDVERLRFPRRPARGV